MMLRDRFAPTKHLFEGDFMLDADGQMRAFIRRRKLSFKERVIEALKAPVFMLLGAGTFTLFSTSQKNALDWIFGLAQSPAARTLYVMLCASAPTDGDTAAGLIAKELLATPPVNGYARQAFGPAAATVADPSVIQNNGIITFGPFTADPPNCTHFAVIVEQTGTPASLSNLIGWGAWGTARDAANGDSLQIAAGALNTSLT